MQKKIKQNTNIDNSSTWNESTFAAKMKLNENVAGVFARWQYPTISMAPFLWHSLTWLLFSSSSPALFRSFEQIQLKPHVGSHFFSKKAIRFFCHFFRTLCMFLAHFFLLVFIGVFCYLTSFWFTWMSCELQHFYRLNVDIGIFPGQKESFYHEFKQFLWLKTWISFTFISHRWVLCVKETFQMSSEIKWSIFFVCEQ